MAGATTKVWRARRRTSPSSYRPRSDHEPLALPCGRALSESGVRAALARGQSPEFFAKAPHWQTAVVSGTADSAVPFVGTERWMECLGRETVDDWRLW